MKAIEGWKKTALDSKIAVIQSGSRPKGGASSDRGDIPSLGGENIIASGGVTLSDVKLVPFDFYNQMTKGHLQDGDVLINKDGAQTGKLGYYRSQLNPPACINEHLFLLRGKSDLIDQKYLYYTLLSQNGQNQIRSQISGSAQPGLKSGFLKGIIADLPDSLPEQTKIADILSTVDRAIEQTEALIAKQQRIKTGLMQDLLTRGIDEHGILRSEQTHKFRDSKTPLGRIPVEWEVKVLRDSYAEPARNGLYKPKEFYGTGNSMVHMPQMFRGLTVDLTSAVRVQVDRSEIDRFGLQKDDLLIARRSLVLEGAGRCALVPVVTEPTTFESSIIRVRLRQDQLNATFANFFLNSDAGYRMRLPFIRQVAVSGVAGEDVGQFYIPVPDADEQIRIIDCFSKSEVLICSMIATANKLKRQKTALMQDLLTGKKRVTMLLNKEVTV